MVSPQTEKVEDLVPVVRKYLVPSIEKAVVASVDAHAADPYNDNYTFGTQFWKNTWNRIDEIAASGETPIKLHGKGNEYTFRIGRFILRHHRVGGENLLPNSAKSAKSAAVQLNLFDPTYPNMLPGENIILAIEADPRGGLRDIFIGDLKQDPYSAQLYWEKAIPVFTPEELLILKGEAVMRYLPIESEPGDLVNLEIEQATASAMNGGKINA
jgi:hypothetical protein